jgi:hypothetical protein
VHKRLGTQTRSDEEHITNHTSKKKKIAVAHLVEALRYKAKCHGFDS